jgi:hypothetical protein
MRQVKCMTFDNCLTQLEYAIISMDQYCQISFGSNILNEQHTSTVVKKGGALVKNFALGDFSPLTLLIN